MHEQRTRVGAFLAAAVGLCSAVLGAGHARANGNYTHLWVAMDAVSHLEDAELAKLLSDPGLFEVMRNGSNFPDGGYAMDDNYGEIGHWEPFQTLYLEWIRDTYGPPWSDEAKVHIAFLMGMAAHGLTDQLFDGMYLERHYVFDENSASGEWGNIDGVTDVCFAARMGPMELPEAWVPADVMADLFAESGHPVAPATIETGQSLVGVAVMYTNDKRTEKATLESFMTLYPWACGHVDDPSVPGSPISLGVPVARYMEVLWARLNGAEGFGQPLLGTWFSTGEPFNQPRDSGSPDSWVSFAMPRGLDKSTVTYTSIAVAGPDGGTHLVTLQLYYGNASHLVNIRPTQDWVADTDYTVTISAPLASWNGIELEGTREFQFATGPEPGGDDIQGGEDGTAEELRSEDSVEEAREAAAPAEVILENDTGSGHPCVDGTGKSCGSNEGWGCSVGSGAVAWNRPGSWGKQASDAGTVAAGAMLVALLLAMRTTQRKRHRGV